MIWLVLIGVAAGVLGGLAMIWAVLIGTPANVVGGLVQ